MPAIGLKKQFSKVITPALQPKYTELRSDSNTASILQVDSNIKIKMPDHGWEPDSQGRVPERCACNRPGLSKFEAAVKLPTRTDLHPAGPPMTPISAKKGP